VKTLMLVIVICSLFVAGVSPVYSQSQLFEGYTVIGGPSGAQVCMGRWVPSQDVALPGVCEGQLVDVAQFTAIFTKMSAERLDQVTLLLGSIDQKLAFNNDQLGRLLDTTAKTQASVDQQVSQMNELLRETITKKFDALSEKILASEPFKAEFLRLKDDILREVERLYPTGLAPVKK